MEIASLSGAQDDPRYFKSAWFAVNEFLVLIFHPPMAVIGRQGWY